MRHLTAQAILTQPIGTLPPLEADTVRAVMRCYADHEVQEMEIETGGTANANVQIHTAAGSYYLRRRARHYAAPDLVAHDHAFRSHLAAQGLPVEPLLPARNGATAVKFEGEVYELARARPGALLEPQRLPPLANAGRLLASVHRAAGLFKPPRPKPWGRYDPPDAALELVEHLLGRAPTSEQRDILVFLQAQARRLVERFPNDRYQALPPLVIHGDYHPANLKFLDDEVSGLFDFDMACWQPRVLDVADGLLFFGGRRSEAFDGRTMAALTRSSLPDLERWQVFLRGYLEAGELTAAERTALPWCLRARWLYSRLAGLRKMPPADWLGYATAGIVGPLEWLDGNGEEVEELMLSL